MDFLELGTVRFEEALTLQETICREVAEGRRPETVLLLEHPHVLTQGRAGRQESLLLTRDRKGRSIPVVRTSRGGDATYHGPGQLVVYPLLNLRLRGQDVHRYLRNLEEALLNTVAGLGVEAYRRKQLTGIWTPRGKLASIGIGVKRWVTLHGAALNVSTDLSYFEMIQPCGMPDCPVTSLSELLSREIRVCDVIPIFIKSFTEVFQLETHPAAH